MMMHTRMHVRTTRTHPHTHTLTDNGKRVAFDFRWERGDGGSRTHLSYYRTALLSVGANLLKWLCVRVCVCVYVTETPVRAICKVRSDSGDKQRPTTIESRRSCTDYN